jgi:hypothetical protein
MTTKTVDARGRIALGPRYANRLVIVREHKDGALEIIPAEAIPAREVWLFKNAEARKAVHAGIEEARTGSSPSPRTLRQTRTSTRTAVDGRR